MSVAHFLWLIRLSRVLLRAAMSFPIRRARAFASSIRPARLWRFFRRSFDLIAGVMYNPNPSSASSGAESHCPVQVRRHHQAICRYRRWPCRHLASDARRRTPPWQTTTLAILVAVHWWTISASFSPTRCTVYGILSSPTYINLPAHSLRHVRQHVGPARTEFSRVTGWQLTKCSRLCDRRVSIVTVRSVTIVTSPSVDRHLCTSPCPYG